MHARVAYWTTWFSPGTEGISNEVASLAEHFGNSVVFCVSRRWWFRASLKARCVFVHPYSYHVSRLAWFILRMGMDVSHCIGTMDCWYMLRILDFAPQVLTIIGPSPRPVAAEQFSRVRFVVAECGATLAWLRGLGFDEDRLRLVHPGVDLHRFRPTGVAPGRRLRVLFASSPSSMAGLDERGVWPLLRAALVTPDVDYVLLWRAWSPGRDLLERWVREQGLSNVQFQCADAKDIPSVVSRSDVVAAPFLPGGGKSCPNSVLEALACGKPVIVSPALGIADLVATARAGLVVLPEPASIAAGVQGVAREYKAMSVAARYLAESEFSMDRFLESYARLYETVLGRPVAVPGSSAVAVSQKQARP